MCKLGKDECLKYHYHDDETKDADPETCLGLGRRSFEQFRSQAESTFTRPTLPEKPAIEARQDPEAHVDEEPPIVVPKASLASEIAGLIRWNRRKSSLSN